MHRLAKIQRHRLRIRIDLRGTHHRLALDRRQRDTANAKVSRIQHQDRHRLRDIQVDRDLARELQVRRIRHHFDGIMAGRRTPRQLRRDPRRRPGGRLGHGGLNKGKRRSRQQQGR